MLSSSQPLNKLIPSLLFSLCLLASTSTQAFAALLGQEVCASSDTLTIQPTGSSTDNCSTVTNGNTPEFFVPGPQGILIDIDSESIWLTRMVSGPFTDFAFDIDLSELTWGDKKGKIIGVSSSGDDSNFTTAHTDNTLVISYDPGASPGFADDLEVHLDLEVQHISEPSPTFGLLALGVVAVGSVLKQKARAKL